MRTVTSKKRRTILFQDYRQTIDFILNKFQRIENSVALGMASTEPDSSEAAAAAAAGDFSAGETSSHIPEF